MAKFPDLIEIDQICKSDMPLYGSKASMLGELRSHGFPVPDGFCLSVNAFKKAGADLYLSPALETALQATANRFLQTNPFLAVRSSANMEDLPGVSYAGIYDSVIGVSTLDDLKTAIKFVWKSYNKPAATALRATYKQENPNNGMGVIVQTAINAEVAGVCFSVDPVQPFSGHLVINASWGLGAGVVNGSVSADTFWLQREDLVVVNQRIVEKDAGFGLDPQAGLIKYPLSEVQQRTECLPEKWTRHIAQFAMAIEQLFGGPQDVEWAIADGKVWILQSRPIASLMGHDGVKKFTFPIHWQNPEDSKRLWRRYRYDDQRSAPLLPLDIDFVRLLESTRVETCLRMGADRNEDFRVINGHIFTSPAPMPIREADRLVRQQAFRDLLSRLTAEGRTTWDHWGPEIEAANQRLAVVNTNDMDGIALAGFLETAMAVLSRNNMLHPMMAFKPRQSYFEAFSAISGLSGTESEAAAYRLLETEETPLSRLIDGLYELAKSARKIPAVFDWMKTVAFTDSIQVGKEFLDYPTTAPGAKRWYQKLMAFLKEYGDRSGQGYGSESLISAPTWRDQPFLVIKLASQYLDEAVESPKLMRERSRQAIEAQVQTLCAQCPDTHIIDYFMDQLHIARRFMPIIEIHNHHIEQVSRGQLRRALMAAANWLHSAKVLSDVEELFWLEFSEIVSALRQDDWKGLANKIKARQEKYQLWSQYQPPPYLGLPSAKVAPRSVAAEPQILETLVKARQTRGIGASAGIVSSRARVIETWESEPHIEPGDILVAENAGPLWLPFFPILSGIVLETGSIGQHAASTAREYGIPAVMDVDNARRIIKDGDWITIDGTLGIIELGS